MNYVMLLEKKRPENKQKTQRSIFFGKKGKSLTKTMVGKRREKKKIREEKERGEKEMIKMSECFRQKKRRCAFVSFVSFSMFLSLAFY